MKHTYTAVVTSTEDGVEFYARIPDLPGCVTTGDSIEDAVEQITDSASLWLVSAEDRGLDIPAATTQSRLRQNDGCVLVPIHAVTAVYRAKISIP